MMLFTAFRFLSISESIGDAVHEKLMQAIDILRYFFKEDPNFLAKHPESSTFTLQLGIVDMGVGFILQLIATLILFLVVRYKFWNKITDTLTKRKKMIESSLNDADAATKLAEEKRIEAQGVKQVARKEANEIIEEAKRQAEAEALVIKKKNEEQIASSKRQAQEEIAKERQEMENQVKDEIVDVAYAMAEKMVGHEINPENQEQIVSDTMKELQDKAKDQK
jgi:F-type H+-transporting ATPase subunit b